MYSIDSSLPFVFDPPPSLSFSPPLPFFLQLPFAIIPVLTFTASAAVMNLANYNENTHDATNRPPPPYRSRRRSSVDIDGIGGGGGVGGCGVGGGGVTGEVNRRFTNRGPMLGLALALTVLVLGANVIKNTFNLLRKKEKGACVSYFFLFLFDKRWWCLSFGILF